MTFEDAPLLLTLKNVSAVFGFPYSTLRKWIINPDAQMPGSKIGGKHYINKHEMLEWTKTDHDHLT